MGKPTGFLEHPRRERPHEAPRVRLAVWEELVHEPPTSELTQQAARCMDCGVPFCQSDTGCPVDNLIPEWNDLVYRGRWREALARLHRTNNFPEFTGRVCPAPCEGACVLGINQDPVTIKSLEQAIVDRGFDEGWIVPRPPEEERDTRVAIVGSGPAGLAAAQQLRRLGHRVTVYERADRVGGLLTYGIPNMKLDKRLVERRVEQLRGEGVAFQTGVDVGRTMSVEALRDAHDAVLLATGATVPRDLTVPGRRGLGGVVFAMDYLTASTQAVLGDGAPPPELDAAGRRVLVIGGGDTGTDCIATALRQGCASLTNLELLERPPAARGVENPWPEWPRVFRVDYGHEEAAARFGDDPREFGIKTVRFSDDGAGHVTGVETVEVAWERSPSGQLAMRELPGTGRVFEADLVLLALGFTGPDEIVGLDALRDARTNFAAPRGRYATSLEGVFAAGDCRRGQSLVVWAIEEGRAAAAAIDAHLAG